MACGVIHEADEAGDIRLWRLLAWNLVMAKEYGVIDRVIWGSDYDVYWHDDWDFSGYFRKVRAETTWLRSGANEVLHRCGWPTLTDDEIGGILGDNVKRLKRIESCEANVVPLAAF